MSGFNLPNGVSENFSGMSIEQLENYRDRMLAEAEGNPHAAEDYNREAREAQDVIDYLEDYAKSVRGE